MVPFLRQVKYYPLGNSEIYKHVAMLKLYLLKAEIKW